MSQRMLDAVCSCTQCWEHERIQRWIHEYQIQIGIWRRRLEKKRDHTNLLRSVAEGVAEPLDKA